LNADSTRRGIRKAEKAGVRVERASSPAEWEAFARLEDVTARGHGLPAPPHAFFTVMCAGLQREGFSDLYLGYLADGRLAAGTVVWKGAREWIYAFNASDPHMLDHRPNHALLWTAIRDAAAAGVTFDLGRAAPEQKSLVEYKTRWGGQPVPLLYDYWPEATGLNVARRDAGLLALAGRAWRLLPLPLTQAGSRLYRYLG
jgi:lipid II:glycine glycyltransferase (peptidoglycan interpeptide bridge formation enzyme)